MPSKQVITAANAVIEALHIRKLCLATAESCTGGLISAALTEISGASEVFERGFITYSNASKVDLLTVPTFYIEDHGPVSAEVVTAMAEGALLLSRADISVAVTGYAGPGGGTKNHPAGTVFIGCAIRNQEVSYERFSFKGSRKAVRLNAAMAALNMVLKKLGDSETRQP